MMSKNIITRTGPHVCFETEWTKNQADFERDRKECIDSFDRNLDSEAFGKALEGCFEEKGYKFKIAEEHRSSVGIVALAIVLTPLAIAYGILLIGRVP